MTSMPQPTAETGSTSNTPAVLTHLGGILFSFIPSLIVFLVQRGTGSNLYEQAKEALNLQITVFLGMVVAGILAFIVNVPVGGLVWIVGVIFAVIGARAAAKGELYRNRSILRLVN